MKILITGICGFVGSTLARGWREAGANHEIIGLDNLGRGGSETNRALLRKLGVKLHHGDLRLASDMDALPPVDYVIDAAANPSVLAGVDGRSSSKQVVEHNLLGTIHMLEYCRRHKAGFVLLSTSRVYSIAALSAIAVESDGIALRPAKPDQWPAGFSARGVAESFSTAAPVSLYGATKVASEALALEYGHSFEFPVWINRCGVMAGAGQFGHAEQGIFSYWIHAWLARRPLKYIGFGGLGHQVRDAMHPLDLLPVLDQQLAHTSFDTPRIHNLAGGIENCMSLAQLTAWCTEQFGPPGIPVASDPQPRRFDIPWLVLDATAARQRWQFTPHRRMNDILEEIAAFAQANPQWLELAGG